MTTRQQLLADVDSWLARDDVSAGPEINSIVLLAEDYIATDLRLVAQERTATLELSGRSVAAPDNYLTWRAVFVDGEAAEYQTPELLRSSRGQPRGAGSRIFTIEGGDEDTVQFVFEPAATEDDPQEVELLYFARIPPLNTNDEATNWLLKNHYSVYLYATLRAAAEWVQELELEDRYAAKYQTCVDRLNRTEQRKRYGAGARRTHGQRYPVV